MKTRREFLAKVSCASGVLALGNSIWNRASAAKVPAHADRGEVAAIVHAGQPKWRISKNLVGMHVVYCNNPDKAYADGTVADWAKQAGIATARYPGGTVVKYWDWRDPTGVMTKDRWSPKFDPSCVRPPEDWMSLDEYLDFVKRSGITPLLGVNSLSGYVHNKTDESVRRAAEMVEYVRKKGFGGAFWYIGNEEENDYKGRLSGYAAHFHRHAEAMKMIDPAIRIFWNCNNVSVEGIYEFLAHDGGTSDGLETHGKWPYGGDPAKLRAATFEDWLNETPLRDWKNHRLWRAAANRYREAASKAGRKHYLIANNEYGIGKDQNIKGFDRYTFGLLLTEFLQEHFIGDWDMTCFWDSVLEDERGLLSGPNNYRMNPFHFGMQLLAAAQGGLMVEVQTNVPSVHGFAAIKSDELLVYVINKTRENQTLSITLDGITSSGVSGQIMRDTSDHWGELVPLTVNAGERPSAAMPPLSFCQMRFTITKQT